MEREREWKEKGCIGGRRGGGEGRWPSLEGIGGVRGRRPNRVGFSGLYKMLFTYLIRLGNNLYEIFLAERSRAGKLVN